MTTLIQRLIPPTWVRENAPAPSSARASHEQGDRELDTARVRLDEIERRALQSALRFPTSASRRAR